MEIFDKVKEAVASNSEQVEAGIDQAGDFVDQKTDNKYQAQVDQGQEFLKNQVQGLQPKD